MLLSSIWATLEDWRLWFCRRLPSTRNNSLRISQYSPSSLQVNSTMKYIAALLAVVGSATAFAPAQQARTTSVSLEAFEDALGATAPVS